MFARGDQHLLKIRLLLSLLVAGLAVAACGGGSSNSVSPSTSPTSSGSSPFVVETTVPVNSNGTLTLPLNAQAFTGTLQLTGVTSSVTSGVTVDLTIESSLPPGFPVLQSIARTVAGRAAVTALASPASLLYIEPIFSATVSGTGGSIVLTVPSSSLVAGANYYVAFFDPSATSLGWQTDFAGPASVSGNVLTFALTSPVTFVSRTTYALTVYAISSGAAQPTPVPTALPSTAPTKPTPSPTPSPAPSPTPTASPAPGVLSITPTSVSIPSPGTTQIVAVPQHPSDSMSRGT